jgi:uncharacterized protein (DUF2062 family)
MIAFTRAVVRKWVEKLFHLHDTPKRTAAAFALGVFFGFSPFLGFHTVLALACAFVFNLNRVAVLVGVYSNLPWIIAAWYALTTALGAWLLRSHLPHGFGETLRALFELSLFKPHFWDRLWTLMRPLLWPYVVGSVIGAAALAVVAYYLVLGWLEARHRLHLETLHLEKLHLEKLRRHHKD